MSGDPSGYDPWSMSGWSDSDWSSMSGWSDLDWSHMDSWSFSYMDGYSSHMDSWSFMMDSMQWDTSDSMAWWHHSSDISAFDISEVDAGTLGTKFADEDTVVFERDALTYDTAVFDDPRSCEAARDWSHMDGWSFSYMDSYSSYMDSYSSYMDSYSSHMDSWSTSVGDGAEEAAPAAEGPPSTSIGDGAEEAAPASIASFVRVQTSSPLTAQALARPCNFPGAHLAVSHLQVETTNNHAATGETCVTLEIVRDGLLNDAITLHMRAQWDCTDPWMYRNPQHGTAVYRGEVLLPSPLTLRSPMATRD